MDVVSDQKRKARERPKKKISFGAINNMNRLLNKLYIVRKIIAGKVVDIVRF